MPIKCLYIIYESVRKDNILLNTIKYLSFRWYFDVKWGMQQTKLFFSSTQWRRQRMRKFSVHKHITNITDTENPKHTLNSYVLNYAALKPAMWNIWLIIWLYKNFTYFFWFLLLLLLLPSLVITFLDWERLRWDFLIGSGQVNVGMILEPNLIFHRHPSVTENVISEASPDNICNELCTEWII